MEANVQNMRTNLFRQINQWRQAQQLHMPRIHTYRQCENSAIPDQAEQLPLYLPSNVPHLAPSELRELEARLRKAQADDALSTIRRLRRAITGVIAFKRKNVSGMGNRSNTRMQTLFSKFQSKIGLAKQRYRSARAALISLEPEGDWHTTLKELKDEDIRGPNREDDEETDRRKKRTGEGRYQPSWIWMTPGANLSNDGSDIIEFGDSVRVEWAKAKARVERWEEEIRLLCEEMRRVVCFLNWKSKWWDDQRGMRSDTVLAVVRGLDAYASKQAAIHSRLASIFLTQWIPRLNALEDRPSWVTAYPTSILTDTTVLQDADEVEEPTTYEDDEDNDGESPSDTHIASLHDDIDPYNEDDLLTLAVHNNTIGDPSSDVE